MKEHESSLLEIGEKFYLRVGEEFRVSNKEEYVYVDSNNFVHRLDGEVYHYFTGVYCIHGEEYKSKGEFEIAKNRLLTLEEI